MAISPVNHGLWKITVLYGFVKKLPQTRVLGSNHGYSTGKFRVWGWKEFPPEIYLQKIEKKYTVSRLNVIIFGWVYKENNKKEIASNSTHACQIKWAEP